MRHIGKKITKLVFVLAALAGIGSFAFLCIDHWLELADPLSLTADQRRANTIIAIEKFYNGDFNGAFSMGKNGNLNDKELQYCLGWLYFDGKGINEDKGEGFRLWLESARQGYAKAQNDVAIVYERGELGERNIDKAIQWYSRAAAQGMSTAMLHIGYIYENGIGGVFNGHKAIEWYTKAYEQGNGHAAWHLAKIYEEGFIVNKDKNRAGEWYRKAAEKGDGASICHIATQYYLRMGDSDSRIQGEGMLADAATNGFSLARHLLVNYPEIGLNRDQGSDIAKAHEWCKRFAIEGDQAFQIRLADMYLEGVVQGKTASDAAKWYKAACRGRDVYPEAFLKLGKLYSSGKGVQRDEAMAFRLFQKAVEGDGDFDEALLALGDAYRRGVGVDLNIKKAIECYQKAAEHEDGNAILCLAEIYENGESVKKNVAKALTYYTKLADIADEEIEYAAIEGVKRCRLAIEKANRLRTVALYVTTLIALCYIGWFIRYRSKFVKRKTNCANR